MAINVRITTTDILMDVTVVRPGAVTVAGVPQAYPTWQKILAMATAGYDPTCPFFFDTVGTSDAVVWTISLGNVSVADSVAVSDAVATIRNLFSSASDTATATDSVSSIQDFARIVGDAATATDAISITSLFSRTVSDTVSAADNTATSSPTSQNISDAATATDNTIVFDRSTSVADAATASDATIVFSRSTSVSDTASATDGVVTSLAPAALTPADSAAVSDSLQIILLRANVYGEVANASPLNTAALNSNVAWVEQWTYNY